MKSWVLFGLLAFWSVECHARVLVIDPSPFVGQYLAVEGACVRDTGPYPAEVSFEASSQSLILRENPNGKASVSTFAMTDRVEKPAPGTEPADQGKTSLVHQVLVLEDGKILSISKLYLRDEIVQKGELIMLNAANPEYLIVLEGKGDCKYQRSR